MLHALELLLDADGDAAVRRDWQLLRDAGLPSQLDHRGATNAPHVTLVAGPTVLPAEDRAVELLASLLPAPARVSGLLVLGGRRVTVAWALEVPDALLSAAIEVRRLLPDHPHRGWLPHLTLARRVERDEVHAVVATLGHGDAVLTLETLRRWDPDAGVVTRLAGR